MLASIRLFFAILGRVSPAVAGRLAAKLFSRPTRHRRPDRERELIARGTPVPLPDGLSATAWGAGPTVLLVHGWEGRGAQLGAFVDPFVAAGYRVVALDGPAHGDSSGRTTTGPEFAQAIARTREEIGPLAAIVALGLTLASIFLQRRGDLATDFIAGIYGDWRDIHAGMRRIAARIRVSSSWIPNGFVT